MKKILALVLAMLMVAGMMSALATGSINIDGAVTNLSDEGVAAHEYKVYQIYKGVLEGNKLTNVKYGANYGSTGASVPKSELDGITQANIAQKAKDFEAALHGAPVATLTAPNFSVDNLEDGYYLIVDDTAKTLVDGDVYSRYIVEVLGTKTDVKVKKEVPSGDKVIDDDTLGAGTTNTELAGDTTTKIDNVSIGDTVTFKLTATVPTDATYYNKYLFILNDTLSEGLTFDKASAEITVTATDIADPLAENTDYKVYTGNDCGGNPKHTFEIAMIDAKALAGKTITVTYKATLNDLAKIDDVSNPNDYTITYSKNPNHQYQGDNDKPGKPASTDTDAMGDTPNKRTETFSSGLKIRKVDQEGLSLAGATFTLEGDSLEKVFTYTESFTAAADGTYYKLKNGSYTTADPIADSMIAAPAGSTDGYVLYSDSNTNNDDVEVVVGGTGYRVVHAGETPQYILKRGNANLYDEYDAQTNTYTKYTKTETKSVKDSAEHKSETLTVGADGELKFKGLGEGEYTITEINAPEGYTKLDTPIVVVITFTENPAANASHWEAHLKSDENKTYSKDAEGYFTVTVENKAGNTLPSTGGIGTTLFYVGGGILVLLAVILLVTKRRMNANND